MTKFGKFLVYFNLAVSLSLMIWAMSLYLTRTDWTDNAAKADKPAGELVARIARVKAAWYPMLTSERDWRESRQKLLAVEEQRRDTRRWYDAELAKLEKDPALNQVGQLGKVQPAQLRETVPDKAGEPDLDVGGNPDPNFPSAIRIKMKPALDWGTIVVDAMGKPKRDEHPLAARNVYDLREDEIFNGNPVTMSEGLLAARTRHRKGVEDNVETITRMLGPTGLHARLKDEKSKREGVVAEYDSIKPSLVNTAASSSFALERVKELKARVQELEEKRDELRRKLGVAGVPEQ